MADVMPPAVVVMVEGEATAVPRPMAAQRRRRCPKAVEETGRRQDTVRAGGSFVRCRCAVGTARLCDPAMRQIAVRRSRLTVDRRDISARE